MKVQISDLKNDNHEANDVIQNTLQRRQTFDQFDVVFCCYHCDSQPDIPKMYYSEVLFQMERR